MAVERGLVAICLTLVALCTPIRGDEEVIVMTDADSGQLREGEWLVKFYAPWCPACQQFAAPWISLGRQLRQSHPDVKVAKVDVTEQPTLSGRFLIQALPTIYHIKDGQCRLYEGMRVENDVEGFIANKEWQDQEAIAWYISPLGPTGTALGYAMIAGHRLQGVFEKLTKEHGLPAWLVVTFGCVGVISTGMLVGLLLVVCISMFSSNAVPADERIVYPGMKEGSKTFGSTGDKDEVDRKKGPAKASPKPKQVEQEAAASSTAEGSSSRQRKGKGKKTKGSTH